MSTPQTPMQQLIESLQERAKELNCLYLVDEILSDPDRPLQEVCDELVAAIPSGWQYPDACCARLSIKNVRCEIPGCATTSWSLTAPVVVDGEQIGMLSVCYKSEQAAADEGPFLKEERKLINTIAERIGFFVTR
ncbi:MAG: GAF domain-containing protein, partial [Acidobacteriota bacterium]